MNPNNPPDSITVLGVVIAQLEATFKELGKGRWCFKRLSAHLYASPYWVLHDWSACLNRCREIAYRLKNIKEETEAVGVGFYA